MLNNPTSFSSILFCSATAGTLAGAVSNVIDVVKTRVQVSQHSLHPVKLIKEMWTKEGGPRAFTKGLGARILFITPSVTISMTTYEMFKKFIF